ncbi:MAG TPA: polysaccharide deacetylase family protein [Blastocatellia bacterium]|nr:polysaccharide deacetylase family protein [Blastocatellia bacterium]
MRRRQFTKLISAGAMAMAFHPILGTAAPKPQVAITMDDFGLFGETDAEKVANSREILAALASHSSLKAAAFICGRRVDSEAGQRVLQAWDDAGHLIANHTYSHWYYHRRGVEEFEADILRCEELIKSYPRFTKLFRFPMLKEGDTVERRDKLRAFLKERGYKMGYVTIDASDWYVDERLRERLKRDPKADLSGYRRFYLDHIWERAVYYDDLSRRALGRSVNHTLLIHHNLLNKLFLGDLLKMFERKGWKLIDASEAFTDPVFGAEPKILPAGESILWALAKESGKFDRDLRYPGEDSVYEKPKMDRLGL